MYPVLADFVFKMDVDALLNSLPVMGMGMLGIFIVTGLIIVTISTLNFLTKPRKKDGH